MSYRLNDTSSDEEIINSSENDAPSRPSRSLTIEESDESDNGDDSIIVARRPKVAENRRRVLAISSDEESDDDDDDRFERRALSPRTRMSITGIRPRDMSGSSSEISDSAGSGSETAGSDSDTQVEDRSKRDDVVTANKDRKSVSTNRSSSVSSYRSLDEENVSKSIAESRSRIANQSAAFNESIPIHNSDSEDIDESQMSRSMGYQAKPSPVVKSNRYTANFENSITNKLSSTLYRDAKSPIIESDDSDEVIASSLPKANVIELSSGSEAEDSPLFVSSTPGDTQDHKKKMIQPKIFARNMQATPVSSKVDKKFVSQSFYDRELKKMEELKHDLSNTENLMETIAPKLPDKGKQLANRISQLRIDIRKKAQIVATYEIEEGQKMNKTDEKASIFKVPDWDELSAAVNDIKPKFTGKIGLSTFNNQKALTVERLKDIHGSLETCPGEDVLADDPKGLKVQLMDHQKHALAWMRWREQQKPRGGILADDMGLGKTLTMISLILGAKQLEEEEEENQSEDSEDENAKEDNGWSSKGRKDYLKGGTLIVCPASLLMQWESEVKNRTNRNLLATCVHHGNNRESKSKTLKKFDIVVTTYNLVSREVKTHGALFGIKWNRIILDEAHVIRNHKSQSSLGVCALKGKYRWTLTGTPIQNKEMDVYALLKFLKCSPFDDLMHWKKWIDNKSAGGQQRLNTLMKSLMLRRTKQQLQEKGALQNLPQKEIHLIEVTLDKDEMNVYQKVMIFSKTLFAQFLYQRAEKNSDLHFTAEASKPTFMQSKDPNGAYHKMHQKISRMHGGNEVKSHEILVLLLRLRQICCHPGLIDAMLEDEADQSHAHSNSENSHSTDIDLLDQLNNLDINDEQATSLLGESADSSRHEAMSKASAKVLMKSNPVFNMTRASTKMKKVLDVIEEKVLNTTDKAIIVSQWTSVLLILKTHLAERRIPSVSLDGSVAVKNRNDIVVDFNSPQSKPKVMLLSLTAGGVGLNLVGANHLLLIDLHWNPQLESQAQDRVFRVGQKKDVHIYKFMCKDTVEERIKALQDRKLAIANDVLTGSKGSAGSKLSMEDLKGLFGM